MKAFLFEGWQTLLMYRYLCREHRDQVRELMLAAKGEAADSHTSEDPTDDLALSDDERVFRRLAAALREFVAELACDRFGFHPDGDSSDVWELLLADAFRSIEFEDVAKAFYYGVDPDFDPHEVVVPEIE